MDERLRALSLSKKDLGKAGLPTVAFLQLVSAACGNSSSEVINPDQAGSSPKPNAGNLFDLPFPEQYYSDMHIQTGYKYQNGSVHGGIDYILGEIDKSAAWKTFPVLASADGKACIPEDRQGNAVLIRHFGMVDTVSGILKKPVQYIDTYSGHLAKYLVDGLSSCKTAISTWIDVKKGQVIGEAGSTGVKDDNGVDQPSWVHTHFQPNVLIKGEPTETHIDLYDLYATREAYPNPNSAKGKCGPQNLLNICGNTTDLVKSTATATPQPSTPTPVTEIKVSPNASIDTQARAAALNTWFKLLSTDQNKEYPKDGVYAILSPKVVDNNTWARNLAQVAETNKLPNNQPMQVNWQIASTYSNQLVRYNGEVQIADIRITYVFPITLAPAEIRNGILWNGNIQINFSRSYHLAGETTFYQNPDENVRREWFEQPPLPLSASWSPWKDESWFVDMKSENGQWKPGYRGGTVGIPAPLYQVIFPTRTFIAFSDSQECARPSSTFCPPFIQKGGLP